MLNISMKASIIMKVSCLPDSVLFGPERLKHAYRPPACLMCASGEVLYEGYGHGGPGICLGDGQTEAYMKDLGMTVLASA